MEANVKPHRSWLCDEEYCGGSIDHPCVIALQQPVPDMRQSRLRPDGTKEVHGTINYREPEMRQYPRGESAFEDWKRKQKINVCAPQDDALISALASSADEHGKVFERYPVRPTPTRIPGPGTTACDRRWFYTRPAPTPMPGEPYESPVQRMPHLQRVANRTYVSQEVVRALLIIACGELLLIIGLLLR